MTRPQSPSAELNELLIALTEGELSGPQFARLESLLAADPAARAYYEKYMRLCALLEFEFATPEGKDEGFLEQLRGKDSRPCSPPSFPLLPSTLLPGGIALSYLIATLIVSAALLTAWTWKMPGGRHSDSVAQGTSPVARPRTKWHGQAVGKITQMVDCRWADPNTAAEKGSLVSVGRRYALASGLLEITYDPGWKVVLNGPATYEIEARNVGFLSFGKIIVRGEQLGADGGAKRGTYQVGPAQYQILYIRTPKVIVGNRGGEFTVSVNDSGAVHTHLVQGMVQLQLPPGYAAADLLSASSRFWGYRETGPHNEVTVMCATGPMPAGVYLSFLQQSKRGAGAQEAAARMYWQENGRTEKHEDSYNDVEMPKGRRGG